MTPEELDNDWRRACRLDELLSRFPPPPAPDLVSAILRRAQGENWPPDAILAGHAMGYASHGFDAVK